MSQDVSVLSQNSPAGGIEGVPGLVQFYQSGTAEVKRILQNECDVIYECRYCRSMFRSIINFTTHKRQYCKGKYGAVVANSSTLWEQYLEQVQKKEIKEDEAEEKGKDRNMDKNMVKIISTKVENVAVSVPGSSEQLILPTLPRMTRRKTEMVVGLAGEMEGNDQKVIVNIPQNPNTRNPTAKVMTRRSDKDAILNKYSAALPPNELSALHKILHLNPEVIDGLSNKCRHPRCAGIRPFKNFSVFAYHCGMKHSTREKGRKLCCYLCNHTIKEWSNYFQHYTKVHKNVREQHEKYRQEDTDGPSPKKGHRTRSLSPNPDASDEKEEEEENDQTGESSPPIIQPIDTNDSGILDGDDNEDEGPPTLVRMGRPRTRHLRLNPTPARATTRASLTPSACRRVPVQHLSRASSISRAPSEIREIDNEQKKREEQERKANKRLTKDVKWVMESLLKQVVDGESEKIDVSSVRLHGKKRKLRGRAAYNAKCQQLLNQRTRQESLPPPQKKNTPALEDEEEPEEQQEEPEEVEEPKSRKRKVLERSQEPEKEAGPSDVGSARPSRAKKRPDWMESYLLEEKKTTAKDEAPQKDSSVPPAPSRVATPASKAKNTPPKVIPKIRIKPIRRPDSPIPPPAEEREEFVLPESATPLEFSAEPSPIPSPGSSRRKQDMSIARDTSEEATLTIGGKGGNLPSDMSSIPVYLSTQQKAIIFAGIRPAQSENATKKDEAGYICEHCNEWIENLKDARRHVVSHIRIIRLRCKLCNAGAFFLADLRVHLQEKGCPNLHKAGFEIKDSYPCMTRAQADSLCDIVDTVSPGRVKYCNEKIVSVTSKVPYTPDLEIEERILGPDRSKEFATQSKRNPASRKLL